MSEWPDPRILDLFEIDVPILLAPMAGAGTPVLAVAVSEAGGLGSLACSQMTAGQARAALDLIRQGTSRSVNVNFFCHQPPPPNEAQLLAWHALLAPFYLEHDLDPALPDFSSTRIPFNADFCSLVEDYVPEVVSFHFGLPEPSLLQRVRATGAKVISSASTVAEARWLMDRGCDAVIAMGLEAGGHRGNFLATDMARQIGTFALVPQIADAVDVPVIAAGGIADARGVAAAFALGADGVQVGTAFLACKDSGASEAHRQMILGGKAGQTGLTKAFTGRLARGIRNPL